MEIAVGAVAIAFVMAAVLTSVAAVLRWLRTYRRDLRVVDMRNRGCSVSEIAEALNLTDRGVRETLKRIAGTIGPTTEVGDF
jgi:DNA-binding NarL/FixJ family response regulator